MLEATLWLAVAAISVTVCASRGDGTGAGQFTQTHISGAWVQGHERQAGRRHCGQRVIRCRQAGWLWPARLALAGQPHRECLGPLRFIGPWQPPFVFSALNLTRRHHHTTNLSLPILTLSVYLLGRVIYAQNYPHFKRSGSGSIFNGRKRPTGKDSPVGWRDEPGSSAAVAPLPREASNTRKKPPIVLLVDLFA